MHVTPMARIVTRRAPRPCPAAIHSVGRFAAALVALIVLLLVGQVGWAPTALAQREKAVQSPLVLASSQRALVYFGTYTDERSKGIYVADWDRMQRKASNLRLAAALENPSFLAMHPDGRTMYAVCERSKKEGGGDEASGPTLAALKINVEDGSLTLLSQMNTGGDGPCHLEVDPSARYVAVANYGEGSTAIFMLKPGGDLMSRTDFEAHHGGGPDPSRQEGPHAHCVRFTPQGRLYCSDLGTDKIVIYAIGEDGSLRPNDVPYARVAPGAGPRHFSFTADYKNCFVLNELASTITHFQHDPQTGALSPLKTVSTLPLGFDGSNTTAELQITNDMVYASNRGHDSIALFALDSTDPSRSLAPVGHLMLEAKTPRHFLLAGDELFVAGQSNDLVEIFHLAIGKQEGIRLQRGDSIAVGNPVCVLMRSP
jgi:6-phosphogluconolactonase